MNHVRDSILILYPDQFSSSVGIQDILLTEMQEIEMTDDTLTLIPINDKLKALGVVRFARKSNVIDIGFKGGQTVVFGIDRKKVTNTRDNFEKEAKRYPGLSKSTISKSMIVQNNFRSQDKAFHFTENNNNTIIDDFDYKRMLVRIWREKLRGKYWRFSLHDRTER